MQENAAAGGCFNKPVAECLDSAVHQVFPNAPKDQLKILDAGAGTGLTGFELHKLGYTNIDALDISQEMLNVAKEKGVYRRYVCCSLTEKKIDEFETGEFDALIATGVLVKAHVRPAAFVEMIMMVKAGESWSRTTHRKQLSLANGRNQYRRLFSIGFVYVLVWIFVH